MTENGERKNRISTAKESSRRSRRASPLFFRLPFITLRPNEHLKEDRVIYIVALPEENDFLEDCRVFYTRKESVYKPLTFFEQFMEK